jgi:hypothetical protein
MDKKTSPHNHSAAGEHDARMHCSPWSFASLIFISFAIIGIARSLQLFVESDISILKWKLKFVYASKHPIYNKILLYFRL